jgi:phosphoserine phosphatase
VKGISRRDFTALSAAGLAALSQGASFAQTDESGPLPSWNDGAARRAILDAVAAMTDQAGPHYVPPEERLATFDQDGTLWVEHPVYTQVVFALDRVVALAPQHPQWKTVPPFSTVLSGDKAAIGSLSLKEIEKLVVATHTGMDVEVFAATASAWILKAKHPRWSRLYTDLVYQPMLEVMNLLRAKGFAVDIVTGGGQDFVRTYAQATYQLEPQQIIGSALETQYSYAANGEGVLMRSPKLLLNNNMSGKPEDIYLFTGRRPAIAFGNSTGDRQMCEYAASGTGLRLSALVLHDDPQREYAYGPALGLPDTKVGTFTQALYDEAKTRGWIVVSMKNDWSRIFSFG